MNEGNPAPTYDTGSVTRRTGSGFVRLPYARHLDDSIRDAQARDRQENPPMSDTITGLVPDEARQAATEAYRQVHTYPAAALGNALAAAAPFIVAAELRRQADRFAADASVAGSGTNRMGFRVAADRLRARADELDPTEGGTR